MTEWPLYPTLTAEEAEHASRERWLLVCHSCGYKHPIETVGVPPLHCCDKPKPHIHRLSQPCKWCAEEAQ